MGGTHARGICSIALLQVGVLCAGSSLAKRSPWNRQQHRTSYDQKRYTSEHSLAFPFHLSPRPPYLAVVQFQNNHTTASDTISAKKKVSKSHVRQHKPTPPPPTPPPPSLSPPRKRRPVPFPVELTTTKNTHTRNKGVLRREGGDSSPVQRSRRPRRAASA